MKRSTVTKIKVLIVDDLPQVRQGLRTVLQLMADIEVVGEASNGLEAVQLAEQLTPDIVVMDLEMPEMNGFGQSGVVNSYQLSVNSNQLLTTDYCSLITRRKIMTTQTINVGKVDTQIAAVEAKSSAKARVVYLDKLKVALTVLVIAHHAGQAYGPTGGQWPIFSPERSALLGPFFAVNAAFFMGLFFLISGYFVPRAYDRKGATAFLKDRFRRLGIPLLFFGLVYRGKNRKQDGGEIIRLTLIIVPAPCMAIGDGQMMQNHQGDQQYSQIINEKQARFGR